MVSDTTQVIWSLTTSGIFDPVTICRAEIAPDLHSEDPAVKGRRRGSNSAPRLRRIYPLVMTNSLLLKMAIDIVDFPIKNGEFPITNSDFPIKNGEFPIKNGDFPIKHGDFPI